MGHADLTLAASGTVTVEAALLGAPMITYYRVHPLTYFIGKPLVDVPFYSMVNLVAGRALIEEHIQADMTAERLSASALRLLANPDERGRMRVDLLKLREALATADDPIETSARRILNYVEKGITR
jgi:lipid-A-disaccharide synthase